MSKSVQTDGLLLIVLTGLLTLLTVLAVLFVALVRTERSASPVRLDGVRAQLLTRSGMEYAIARLRDNPDPGIGGVTDPSDDWTYREESEVPLPRAWNPSYHAGEPWVDVVPNGRYDPDYDVWDRDLNGNGKYDAWSARLRGTYQPYGDVFKLRVEGHEGKIYLNGGFLDGKDRDGDGIPDHRDTWVSKRVRGYPPHTPGAADAWDIGQGWNGQLTRILDTLVEGWIPAIGLARDASDNAVTYFAQAILEPVLWPEPPRAAETLGTWLIERRPLGGYQTWKQVEEAVVAGLEEEAGNDTVSRLISLSKALPAGSSWSDLLRPHVTLQAWTDTVIHPKGSTILVSQGSSIQHLRSWVQGPPEMEDRAPVAVNLASRPVLIALMSDLMFWSRDGSYNRSGVRYSNRIPPSVAQRVADEIVKVRSRDEDENRNGRLDAGEDLDRNGRLDAPFRSWIQWNDFCDWLYGNSIDGVGTVGWLTSLPVETPRVARNEQARSSLLKVQFNPNGGGLTNVEDDNLEHGWFYGGAGMVPAFKNRVNPYSTEWMFHTPSGFSIESLGELSGREGSPRAHRFAGAGLKLFEVYRAGTQDDFTGGRGLQAYASAAFDGGERAFGAGMGLHGGRGVTVMTYPEPFPLLPNKAAVYDGRIGLATVEEVPDGPVTFLHNFDDGWTASHAGGSPDPADVPESENLPKDPCKSIWDPHEVGFLHPDGVELDFRTSGLNRMLAFPVDGNVAQGGEHGSVIFWRKRLHVNRYYFFSMNRKEGGKTQAMILGVKNSTAGVLVENGFEEGADDDGHFDGNTGDYSPSGRRSSRERIADHYATSYGASSVRRWELRGAFWNLREDRPAYDVALLTGRYSDNLKGTYTYTSQSSGSANMWYDPFRTDGVGNWSGTNFFLGYPHDRDETVGGDISFLDEVAIYDFGPDGEEGLKKAEIAMARRWSEGRYYKYNDAVYTSAPIEVMGGKLKRLYWTWLPTRGYPELNNSHVRVRIRVIEGEDTDEFRNGAGVPLDHPAPGQIRYEARFVPTPEEDWSDFEDGSRPWNRSDDPVLQTPWLEDVTIVYELPDGGAVHNWKEW